MQRFALQFDGSIKEQTRQLLDSARASTQKLVSQSGLDCTFDNSFVPYHQVEAQVATWSCQVVLASMVHTDAAVRQEASECKNMVQEYFSSRYVDTELYSILKEAAGTIGDDDESKRHLCKMTLDVFERNGVHLPQAKLNEVLNVKAQIAALENEYQKNLGEDVSFELYDEAELAGCPDSFVSSLTKDTSSGKLIVTSKPPHVRTVLEFCSVEATRRKHYVLASSRCKDRNAKILSDMVKCRAKAANIMGFKSWAEYKLKPTMAGCVDSVWNMLRVLSDNLKPETAGILKNLSDLKLADDPNSKELMSWDYSYYEKKYLNTTCGIDQNVIRKYFPMDFCIRQVMSSYEYLFGIVFERVEDDSKLKWHEDVMVFKISDSESKCDLGFLYLDLFARAGKYAHQCILPISPTYNFGGENRQLPVVANISNLSGKSDGKNHALLVHGEAITFFHEFGHAVHAILSQSDYPIQSWSWNAVPYAAGVEIDFLEVPSKGFEFFAWQSDMLERVSLNSDLVKPSELAAISSTLRNLDSNKPPGKSPHPLPAALTESLKKSEYLFAGYQYMRMVFMTAFDMIIHSIPHTDEYTVPLDIYKNEPLSLKDLNENEMLTLWKKLQFEMTGMKFVNGTNPLANWYHMAMGYDAGYYGYLWAETVAADFFWTLFDPKKNNGDCLNKTNGRRLREHVLGMGAHIPAQEMIHNLLGRPADPTALLKCMKNQE